MKDGSKYEYEIETAESWYPDLVCKCPYCKRCQSVCNGPKEEESCKYCGKIFIIGEVQE